MEIPKAARVLTERPEVILARERSHQDVNTSNEYTKTLVQMVTLINGGAATAILTYYGSGKTAFSSTALLLATMAIGVYCAGIFFAILSGINYRRFITRWSIIWEIRTYLEDQGAYNVRIDELQNEAYAYSTKGRRTLFAGLFCFPAASVVMALSIYIASLTQHPAGPPASPSGITAAGPEAHKPAAQQ